MRLISTARADLFCITAVTDDSSPLVCSQVSQPNPLIADSCTDRGAARVTGLTSENAPGPQIFFYLAFGLFPLLALAVLVALPFPRWGFGLVPRDLLAGAGFLPGLRDAEEARLLREARELVAGEGAHGPYDDWSLRLR